MLFSRECRAAKDPGAGRSPRGPVTRRKNYPGTGIGLAIVARAVERMGGAYGVESEPGKGSRFWIELPAAVYPGSFRNQDMS